ncbi:phospholipase-like protein, partial [Tanacetum coccineum]
LASLLASLLLAAASLLLVAASLLEYIEDTHEDDENNHSNGYAKKGITRLCKFHREYGKPDVVKLSVTFDALNRISGKHRALFTSFLGDMVREHIGLFPVNEPKTHWCLAELEIRTGVVTFYDSLGWAGGSRRRWWRQIKKLLPKKLTVYLVMHGIFESKGISADDYKITYKLCRNLPLTVDDPLKIALAYRERMLEYFWSHKIPVERTSSVV